MAVAVAALLWDHHWRCPLERWEHLGGFAAAGVCVADCVVAAAVGGVRVAVRVRVGPGGGGAVSAATAGRGRALALLLTPHRLQPLRKVTLVVHTGAGDFGFVGIRWAVFVCC